MVGAIFIQGFSIVYEGCIEKKQKLHSQTERCLLIRRKTQLVFSANKKHSAGVAKFFSEIVGLLATNQLGPFCHNSSTFEIHRRVDTRSTASA